MNVSNSIVSSSTSDSLAYLATRAAGKAVEVAAGSDSAAHLAGGSHDPSAQVSLSVEALLVLSGVREEQSSALPALTQAERENRDTEALEQREYAAFRHHLDRGDEKSYYRAYIDYFDSMPVEDQESPRYAGTRENAVAALRTIAYNERVADMAAPEAAGEIVRRATPIAAIIQPGRQDYENAARAGMRISRATSMYSLGF